MTLEDIMRTDGVLSYVYGPGARLSRDGQTVILEGQLCVSDQLTGSIWEQISVASFLDAYRTRAIAAIREVRPDMFGES